MNKYGNDIFVGKFNVSNDKGDVDERSESSSDSSSSEERYRKTLNEWKRFARRLVQ